MNTYKAGNAIRIGARFKDADGEYIDPDTSIKCTISLNGTAVVDAADMTRDATGRYYYVWQSLTASEAGNYDVVIVAVHGSYTSTYEDTRMFHLRA